MSEKDESDPQLSLFGVLEESLPHQEVCLGGSPEQRPQGLLKPASLMSELEAAGGAPVFLHPRANRYISLKSCCIAYELQYKRRRSLGLFVCAEGASVSAPRWVGQAEIDQFLHEKAQWLLRKLKEQQDKCTQLHSLRMRWEAGGEFSYLGQIRILRLDLNAREVRLDNSQKYLIIGCAAGRVDAPFLKVTAQTWMQQQALQLFQERCQHYAPLMKVVPQVIKLTSAATRWGSASAQGVIRLHWRLMEMPLDVIDYVVVHELAHLQEMNHSKKFWSLVAQILPDYKQRQLQLKNQLLPV